MNESSCSALEPYALRVLGDSMVPEFADSWSSYSIALTRWEALALRDQR